MCVICAVCPALTPNVRAAGLQRPIVLNAKTFIPLHTPVLGWGDMAGPKLAATINSYLVRVVAWAGPAGLADFRDHGIRLIKRRGRHGLCRRCNGCTGDT